MRKYLLLLLACLTSVFLFAQQTVKLKKKDRKRDIQLITTEGTIILRLYDSTPLHRDNFLRLVKSNYYDSMLFHRVIQNLWYKRETQIANMRSPGSHWEMEF